MRAIHHRESLSVRVERNVIMARGGQRVVEHDSVKLVQPIARPTVDAEVDLLERLKSIGVDVREDAPVFLHVGFAHAGTTSLQRNFFARRNDLFYLGLPYSDAGGFFSYLKYMDDYLLPEELMLKWRREVVYGPLRRGRPITISDETLSETAEVYYCPRHLPADLVAARLKRYFPTAKIIFTLRRQTDYVASMYFNLKRNYAFLAGMPMPNFHAWWDGMRSQLRCLYLQNLDYSHLVGFYATLFGRENILLLPLEELEQYGPSAYLGRLCNFMAIEADGTDISEFNTKRNERMTAAESRLADLVTAGSLDLVAGARSALEEENLVALVGTRPRLDVDFEDRQLQEIRDCVRLGNRQLMQEFGLPLDEFGYLI